MDMDMDTTNSNEHNNPPPATVTNTLSPGENDNGGSRTGSSVGADASKGKDVAVPNVQGGEGGAAGGSYTNAGLAASVVANADLAKGKSLAAEDGGATGAATGGSGGDKAHLMTERGRRKRMKNMFSTMHSLIPHLPEKTDKATIVGEAINYIKRLEGTVVKLEKKKQELALARQAAAAAAAAGFEAGSSSAPPHAAQGAAAMSSIVPHGSRWQQLQPPVAAAPPPLLPVAAVNAGAPAGFQTWSGSNVVLSVTGDDAFISVCAPRRPGLLALVLSVLDKHGIDVIAAQVASNDVRSLFIIHTHVNGAGGENPASEDVYKLAVSEIMVWLCS